MAAMPFQKNTSITEHLFLSGQILFKTRNLKPKSGLLVNKKAFAYFVN